MEEGIIVVSRVGYSALTKDSRLIDSLAGRETFYIYSPRAHTLPPKAICKELHLVELRRSEDYIAGLARLIASRYPVSHVVSVSEQDLLPAAAARDALGLPGLSRRHATLFRDKIEMKNALRGRVDLVPHLESLSSQGLEHFLKEHGKLIIKRRDGYGSQDCHVVQNADDLLVAWASVEAIREEFFAERFVAAPIVHFDAVVRNGVLLFGSLGTYNHPPMDYQASNWLVSSISNKRDKVLLAAQSMLERIVQVYAVTDGVFHLEAFKADDGTLTFGEVAIRPAGGGIADAIYKTWGVHLFEEHVRLQLGLGSLISGNQLKERFAANLLYYARAEGTLREMDLSALEGSSGVQQISRHAVVGHPIGAARYSSDALFTVGLSAQSQRELDRLINLVINKSVVRIEVSAETVSR